MQNMKDGVQGRNSQPAHNNSQNQSTYDYEYEYDDHEDGNDENENEVVYQYGLEYGKSGISHAASRRQMGYSVTYQQQCVPMDVQYHQHQYQNECNYSEDVEQFGGRQQGVRRVYPSRKTKTHPIIKPIAITPNLRNLQYHRLMSSSKKQQSHMKQSNNTNHHHHNNNKNNSVSVSKNRVIIKRKEINDDDEVSVQQKQGSITNMIMSNTTNQQDIQIDNNNTKQATIKMQPKPNPTPTPPQTTTHNTTTNGNAIDINSILSQVMLQNNQHLHRVNQSVVNRLLSIIQNNQEIALTNITNSMNNSRWSSQPRKSHIEYPTHIQHNNTHIKPNSTISQQYNTHTKTHPQPQQQSPQTHPQPQPQPQPLHQPYNTTHKPHNTTHKLDNNLSTITINNIIPTSTKSQQLPSTKTQLSYIKNRELQLSQLENRRSRRKREFEYRTPRLTHPDDNYMRSLQHDDHGSNCTPAHTPRDYCDVSLMQAYSSADNDSTSSTQLRNIHKKSSLQCDQILETPYQSQRDDGTEQPNTMAVPSMTKNKNKKVTQVEISSSVLVCPGPTSVVSPVNQLLNTVPDVGNSHDLGIQDRIVSEVSVQLPITSNQPTHNNNNKSKNINQSKMQSAFVQQSKVQSNVVYKQPVFMEIPSNQQNDNGGLSKMSLAEAFKKRIGKLPSKAQRKAKQMQKMQKQKEQLGMQKQQQQFNTISKSTTKVDTTKQKTRRGNTSLQLDVRSLNKKNKQNIPLTHSQNEPSEQLLNRLIKGSKAEVTKKEMYALTRKNYENLPEVKERKKNQEKKLLELQRLERIKQYQKSIRASKTTIASNN